MDLYRPPPLFLLTRPAHQATHLSTLIENSGGQCMLLPTLAIQASTPEKIARAITRLTHVDHIIFTSANAVAPIMPYWHHLHPPFSIFAVGPATAAALQPFNISAIIPATYNSEGLLVLPALQSIHTQHIVIFSGKGGRPLLKKTLQKRGAIVKKIAVYTRVCPPSLPPDIFPMQEKIALIISTSEISLKNLWHMMGEAKQAWLKKQRLLVISKKMSQLALQLGFIQPPIQAKNATDHAVMEAIFAEKILSPL